MCCLTHLERDRIEFDGLPPEVVTGLKATGEHDRCRCGFGSPCHRRMTGEDLLCDWCRARVSLHSALPYGRHFNWCYSNLSELGMAGNPAIIREIGQG